MPDEDLPKLKKYLMLFISMCVFLFLFIIVIFRLIQIQQVAKEVQAEYIKILKNYTCIPNSQYIGNLENKGCEYFGYWYPECPDKSNLTYIER